MSSDFAGTLSLNGDHFGALKSLDRANPSVLAIYDSRPVFYFDHFNTYAVELMEAGKLEEANHAISIPLASPFACRYDGWLETRDEIAQKRARARSTAGIDRTWKPKNLLRIDPARIAKYPTPLLVGNRPSILSYERWVEIRVAQNNKKEKPSQEETSRQELIDELLKNLTGKYLSNDKLRRMIEIQNEADDEEAGES